MKGVLHINKTRLGEHMIYLVLWIVLLIFPLIQLLLMNGGSDFHWRRILIGWLVMLPYLVLFVVHNSLLVPHCLFKNKSVAYLCLTILLLALFFAYQFIRFKSVGGVLDRPYGDLSSLPPPAKRSIIPRPVLMDTFIAIVLLAVNVAVAIVFKHHNDRESLRRLESMRMQDELKYLKSQIDPHFFMNMLNNIHSMIEVNTDMAQLMVLELSKMMRYILYEGRNSYTTFAKEVAFITNYIELMRQRYSADKVSITVTTPENPSDDIHLSPLLFLAFVENAFKHGVSYEKKTEIDVFMAEENGIIEFRCRNTKPLAYVAEDRQGGVGLVNAKRRLDILYSDKYKLDIEDKDDIYSVTLIIPGL